MATFANAGPLSLSQITYPAYSSGGPTSVLPRGFVWLPTSPKYPWSITRPLLIDYSNTILYVDLSLALPLVDLFSTLLRTHPMIPLLTLTHPDAADVDPNSSEGVDISSSEGVNMMSSECVDMMLTQPPSKLLSVHIPNMSCRRIVLLL
jgi:hypothetical protein